MPLKWLFDRDLNLGPARADTRAFSRSHEYVSE